MTGCGGSPTEQGGDADGDDDHGDAFQRGIREDGGGDGSGAKERGDWDEGFHAIFLVCGLLR